MKNLSFITETLDESISHLKEVSFNVISNQ